MIEFERQCIQCKDCFKTIYKDKKFCGNYCKDINKNIQLNNNWINSVPRKKDIYANDRIEYSRVSKKPTGWMKKFNACRG
jgi:hypothetical protein